MNVASKILHAECCLHCLNQVAETVFQINISEKVVNRTQTGPVFQNCRRDGLLDKMEVIVFQEIQLFPPLALRCHFLKGSWEINEGLPFTHDWRGCQRRQLVRRDSGGPRITVPGQASYFMSVWKKMLPPFFSPSYKLPPGSPLLTHLQTRLNLWLSGSNWQWEFT